MGEPPKKRLRQTVLAEVPKWTIFFKMPINLKYNKGGKIGYWMLFHKKNIKSIWDELTKKYINDELPGVYKLVRSNFPDETGARVILVYLSNSTDEEHRHKVCELIAPYASTKRIYFKYEGSKRSHDEEYIKSSK